MWIKDELATSIFSLRLIIKDICFKIYQVLSLRVLHWIYPVYQAIKFWNHLKRNKLWYQPLYYPDIIVQHISSTFPVGWGWRIHWLHLCRGVRPPNQTSVLDMTLNNLMVKFQWCWSFGECRAPLHCHCSQVHSGLEW